MLTPTEEIGLSDLSLSTRVRQVFDRIAAPEVVALAEEAIRAVLDASRAKNPYLQGVTLERLQAEGVLALSRLGAYWFAATLTVVSCLHRHASPDSTYTVETVQPLSHPRVTFPHRFPVGCSVSAGCSVLVD